jgi:hypothetical protein
MQAKKRYMHKESCAFLGPSDIKSSVEALLQHVRKVWPGRHLL